MDGFLKAIPDAARHPLALAAYAIAAILFLLSGQRLHEIKTIVSRLRDLPEADRSEALRVATGTVLPAKISAEQWIRLNTRRWIFMMSGAVLLSLLAVIAIAMTRPTPAQSETTTVLPDSTERAHVYIDGLDHRLIAQEAGLAALVLIAREKGDPRHVNVEFFNNETRHLSAAMGTLVRGVEYGRLAIGPVVPEMCSPINVWFRAVRMVHSESGILVAESPAVVRLEQSCAPYRVFPLPVLPPGISQIQYQSNN